MPGANNGTGQPYNFQCSKCRLKKGRAFDDFDRSRLARLGDFRRVKLTGRKWRKNDGACGCRNDNWVREYICDDCGHKGRSRHVDLKEKEARENHEQA